MYGTSHNIEEALRTAQHGGGVPLVQPIVLSSQAFYDNSNAMTPLTSAVTKPTLLLHTLSSGAPVATHAREFVQWAGAEGADDYLYLQCRVPENYDELKDSLELVLWSFKHDATGSATANDDCELQCTMYVLPRDSETIVSLAGTNHVLAADSATVNMERIKFDFTRKIVSGTPNRGPIRRGDTILFRLDLNEDIGTDLEVNMANFQMVYRGSVSIWDESARVEFGDNYFKH